MRHRTLLLPLSLLLMFLLLNINKIIATLLCVCNIYCTSDSRSCLYIYTHNAFKCLAASRCPSLYIYIYIPRAFFSHKVEYIYNANTEPFSAVLYTAIRPVTSPYVYVSPSLVPQQSLPLLLLYHVSVFFTHLREPASCAYNTRTLAAAAAAAATTAFSLAALLPRTFRVDRIA